MSLRDVATRAVVLRAIRDFFGDLLTEEVGTIAVQMKEAYDETGAKTIEVTVPGIDGKVGTISLPANRDSIDVISDADLLKWVKAFAPGEVETIQRVRPAFVTVLKGRVVGDYKTGDVYDPTLAAENGGEAVAVLGMKARRGEGFGTPTVKPTTEGKTRIMEQLLPRTLLELTAAPESAKATSVDSNGVVIIDAEVVEDAPVDYTPEQLDGMKRSAVIQVCKDLGLSHTGSLAVLRARILDHQRRTAAEPVVEPEAQAAADKIGEALIAKAKGDAQ